MNTNNRESFASIIIKVISVVLFILLFIWLYSKLPNMTPFYNNVFSKNINYMQDTARRYFTTDKLPTEENEEIKLTLRELEDNKLVVPFVDKNGKTCDLENSYIRIKKENGKYILRSYLDCNGERNYIEETLGCTNLCTTGNCGVTEGTCSDVQSEYRRLIEKKVSIYKCDKGYVRSGKYCYKTKTGEVKAELVQQQDKVTVIEAKTSATSEVKKSVDVIKTTTGGDEYTYQVEEEYTVTDHYRCSCTTQTINGVKKTVCATCERKVQKTRMVTKVGVHPIVTNYSCPDGAIKEGSNDGSLKCYVMEKTGGEKYCEDSKAVLKDGKCYITTPGQKVYQCKSGYTLVGTMCYSKKTVRVNAKVTTSTKKVYEYKWSCKSALDGWEKTGKTR